MKKVSPAAWVGSLYFAESLPYQMVCVFFLLLLAELGFDNATVAFWSSLVTWPWAFKAFWAPALDVRGRKKSWIVFFEIAMGAAMIAAVSFCGFENPLLPLCGIFMLTAFMSSSHDIAADGYYIEVLPASEQAFYCGWRSTFYRLGTIGVNGGLVAAVGWAAGFCASRNFPEISAWQAGLGTAGAVMLLLGIWHWCLLPASPSAGASRPVLAGLWEAFAAFFRKKQVCRAIVFILLFRLAEALLGKISPLFLTDDPSRGGIGLSTAEYGVIYGTIGVSCLIAGGIISGMVVCRFGLGKTLFPMALALNLPDLGYLWLAMVQPESRLAVGGIIAVEQLGYGFGMTAFMLYMASFVEDSGPFRSSHYAFLTGFMAIGMIVPGMAAGYLQSLAGYTGFFALVMAATLPAMAVIPLVKGSYRGDFGSVEKR